MYVGELVFSYLYDVGGEVKLPEAARLIASAPRADVAPDAPPTPERIEPRKSAPTYVELQRPLTYRYPARAIETDKGAQTVAIEARLHAIGAIAVSLRVPFALADLAQVNDLTYLRPSDAGSMEAIARQVADQLSASIQPALVETYVTSVEPETYLVVVLTAAPHAAIDLLAKEGPLLAGILGGERRPERLSDEEVRDNLRTWYRYYDDDLVVVDWDRALVVEPSGKYDDVLAVMEAANLELLELRAYDRYLDQVLEHSYEDLSRFYGRGGLFRSARGVQEELSNARIDLVRVTDSINNIGKIFGDYYLAKLHLGLAERFHLREWETIVREKMSTLNELYVLASDEVSHRRGVVLEGMIVLLFVIDLVLIYMVSGH